MLRALTRTDHEAVYTQEVLKTSMHQADTEQNFGASKEATIGIREYVLL